MGLTHIYLGNVFTFLWVRIMCGSVLLGMAWFDTQDQYWSNTEKTTITHTVSLTYKMEKYGLTDNVVLKLWGLMLKEGNNNIINNNKPRVNQFLYKQVPDSAGKMYTAKNPIEWKRTEHMFLDMFILVQVLGDGDCCGS